MKLSVEQSNYIKGVAIILMFVHHLFGFGDRVFLPSKYIQMLPHLNLEYWLALFSQICVPIFLFVSGYGLFLSKTSNPISRVLRFLGVYWYYLFLFIPVGFLFYPDLKTFGAGDLQFVFNLKTLLFNMFFFKTSFNGEWWFGRIYIEILLLSFLLKKLKLKEMQLLLVFSMIAVFGFSMPHIFDMKIGDNAYVLKLISEFLLWPLPFVFGYILASNDSFLARFINIIPFYAHPIICVFLFYFLKVAGLILATPFFIFFIVRLKFGWFDKILRVFGVYSFQMWLIHSFFCYYYWQEFIYSPGYSVLILVNLCVTSFIFAFVLEKVRIWFVSIFSPACNKLFYRFNEARLFQRD